MPLHHTVLETVLLHFNGGICLTLQSWFIFAHLKRLIKSKLDTCHPPCFMSFFLSIKFYNLPNLHAMNVVFHDFSIYNLNIISWVYATNIHVCPTWCKMIYDLCLSVPHYTCIRCLYSFYVQYLKVSCIFALLVCYLVCACISKCLMHNGPVMD